MSISLASSHWPTATGSGGKGATLLHGCSNGAGFFVWLLYFFTRKNKVTYHNWQYRRGGLLSLTRLAFEQVFKSGDYPYFTPGTLEYDARRRSELPFSRRPWELSCSTCSKFY